MSRLMSGTPSSSILQTRAMKSQFRWPWQVLISAAAVVGGLTWQFWPQAHRPAELVGVWVASPDESATFPIELREDGRARLLNVWCSDLNLSYDDWSLASDDIHFDHRPPTLWTTNLSRLQFTANYYLSWIKRGKKPAAHRRILERSTRTMTLELSDKPIRFRKLTAEEVAAATWLN